MQTSHLREFVLLAKTLNFSAAARHFYISQSALSRHIAALEEELGCALFIRDSRNVVLTAAGESFNRDVQGVLNARDNAIATVNSLKTDSRRPLRVGYLQEPVTPHLEQVYQIMREEAPGVSPKFHVNDYGALYTALVEKRCDLALITDNDPELFEFFDVIPYARDHYVLAVPFDHPLASTESDSIEFERLRDEPMVYPDPINMRPFYNTAERFFNDAGFAPVIGATYYDIPSMFFHVGAGDGLALVLSCSKQFHTNCKFFELTGVDTSIGVCAAWNKDIPAEESAQLRAVFERARKELNA